MHPQWQAIATRLERERKAMAKPAALHRDKAIVMAADATSLDLTVLDKDTTTGIVRLGVFKMPAIPKDIMPPPKGVCVQHVSDATVHVWRASPHPPSCITDRAAPPMRLLFTLPFPHLRRVVMCLCSTVTSCLPA